MAISALYKGTQAPAANAQADASRLLTFSQTPYFEGSKTSLDSTGFVYVPSQCQDGTTLCRLHMSYHGKV